MGENADFGNSFLCCVVRFSVVYLLFTLHYAYNIKYKRLDINRINLRNIKAIPCKRKGSNGFLFKS